ncbi:cation:proton antiporter [Nitrospina watsonii]|uniref:Na(+)/H(+) antiporter NhaP n=1 Tax=Nitrospina watsonii TaxID=1323948 RepID=A0ABN8W871_9BACT|nr:sodium:proton antiporter [Nitrospina watsonii]CAI2719643.1 Na(+)/H(+) antiporter NhaP [Nitrospina watsonii]
MATFDIIAILLFLTATFAYLNHRFLKMPPNIGLMAIALMFSLLLVAVGELAHIPALEKTARVILEGVDFESLLLHGMLGALLFAGALHIDLADLAKQKWIITLLATVGIMVSTFLVGGFTYGVAGVLGLNLPLIYCLVFGALISPTDPIAVLSILKSANAPKELETKITGESLFNDGVAVVVFLVIAGIATGAREPTFGAIALLFLEEAVGGALFGLGTGYIAYRLLKTVDNYQVEVLITVALVIAGYAAAEAIHVSAPIAAVAAGLLIGNHGRTFAMSATTTEHVDTFWELIDEILNAVLFVLLGLEVMILVFDGSSLLAGVLAIPLVLLARFTGVSVPVYLLKFRREFPPKTIRILTWGGLRGGISVALALSLPASPERDVILMMTYVVVVFSVLVQGLTIGKLVRSSLKP